MPLIGDTSSRTVPVVMRERHLETVVRIVALVLICILGMALCSCGNDRNGIASLRSFRLLTPVAPSPPLKPQPLQFDCLR